MVSFFTASNGVYVNANPTGLTYPSSYDITVTCTGAPSGSTVSQILQVHITKNTPPTINNVPGGSTRKIKCLLVLGFCFIGLFLGGGWGWGGCLSLRFVWSFFNIKSLEQIIYIFKNHLTLIHVNKNWLKSNLSFNLASISVDSTTTGSGVTIFTISASDTEGDQLYFEIVCDPTGCPFEVFACKFQY